MSLDIAAVQHHLHVDQLDGWLWYDFHGSNPIAVSMAGLTGAHTTRRWYYFVPVTGTPQKLVHAIEPAVLDGLPGNTRRYAGRQELERGVQDILGTSRRVAMEFSPAGAIPYISRVDGGTIDFVRSFGIDVVSSGDLVGRFEAAWNDAAIETHRAASAHLHRIKDQAFTFVGARLSADLPVHEFEVQQRMMAWFSEAGLMTDAPPIVAAQENAGNPHYAPGPSKTRAIRSNELLLLDLWGKVGQPRAVYADITWVGFSGAPPADISQAFAAAVAGRDAAVDLVERRISSHAPVRGFEVDRAARETITAAGYGDAFIHRTGHSLGEEVHGNGVHMDDYETHDDRRLLPGTGFTIEPGIYFPTFGVRTELNMVVGTDAAVVTGPRQRALVRIPTRS